MIATSQFDKELINKTTEEAETFLKSKGLKIRVVKKDGVALMVTQDVRVDRINVEVNKNRITKVRGQG